MLFLRGHAPRAINHVLTNVNETARTATCSRCGEVTIKRDGDRWRCTNHRITTHRLECIDATNRMAFCRLCATEVPIIKGANGWRCRVAARQGSASYRDANREVIKAKNKAWYEANRDHVRRRHLLKTYGITIEDYDALLETQGGVCAICLGPPRGRGSENEIFHVDHDHDTGAIRGLLCGICNPALAGFADDPERLRRAAEYLARANKGALALLG